MNTPGNRSDQASEVGYGRPPKSGQFQKGRSGNPKGRPKAADRPAPLALRPEDKPTEGYFESEALRLIPRSDGGPDMPASQAMIRVLHHQAVKGHRLAAQYLLKHALKAEAIAHTEAKGNFSFWWGYKKTMEPIVRGRPQPYWPSQDFLPHPDDICIGPGLQVDIDGPIDEPRAKDFDRILALRDVWLKVDAYQAPDHLRQVRRAQRKARLTLPRYARMPVLEIDQCVTLALVIALCHDDALPKRFRLDTSTIKAKLEEAAQTRPEVLEVDIRSEFERLKADVLEPLGGARLVASQRAQAMREALKMAIANYAKASTSRE